MWHGCTFYWKTKDTHWYDNSNLEFYEPKKTLPNKSTGASIRQVRVCIWTTTPPGEFCSLRLQPSVGYHWIPLDPQGLKIGGASQISGPDGRGRRRQVPGGPQQGWHQGLIFEQSCWNKNCLGSLVGLILNFSGRPGPSGWGPGTKDCQE